MNGAALNPFVGWRLQAAGLKRIMTDVSQQCPGMSPGGIHIGRLLLAVVIHQQLGDHGILFGQHIAQRDEQQCCGYDSEKKLAHIIGVDDKGHYDDHQEHISRLDLLSCLQLLGIDDLFAPARGNDANPGGIVILWIGIDQNILQILHRKKLAHCFAEH